MIFKFFETITSGMKLLKTYINKELIQKLFANFQEKRGLEMVKARKKKEK